MVNKGCKPITFKLPPEVNMSFERPLEPKQLMGLLDQMYLVLIRPESKEMP